MEKQKRYTLTRFSVETLREAIGALRDCATEDDRANESFDLRVDVGDDRWTHDSPDEFFEDYRSSTGDASITYRFGYRHEVSVWVFASNNSTTVTVEARERSVIQRVFNLFESDLPNSRIAAPEEPPVAPRIFIGHGHNPQWRDLKDHLVDLHGFEVHAYEMGARAGHAVRDILEKLLKDADIGILVLTKDDESLEGGFHPRLNVVHELGLFQGRLGFVRAVALAEDGVELFSNIHGIQRIDFSANNIRESFGEVVATIRREFPT